MISRYFEQQGIGGVERALLGLDPKATPAFFRGRNPDIDAGGARGYPADLWSAPGDLLVYPFQSDASTLQIVSTAAADSAAGTGARTVRISGLDATWSEISEVVTLNGTTPVATSSSFLRVNAAFVATAGSGETNVGTITVRVSGGGSILGQIEPEAGATFNGIYSTPRNKSFLALSATSSIQRATATSAAELTIYLRDGLNGGAWVDVISYALSTTGTTTHSEFGGSGAIPPGSDIRMRCTFVSANDTRITAAVYGLLCEVP